MLDPDISPWGQMRREQILGLALRQARRRRRRRQAMRIGTICVALCCIGVVTLRVLRTSPDHPGESTAKVSVPNAKSPVDQSQPAKLDIEHIQTDPTIAHRFAVPQVAAKWERIDDVQLLRELAEAGQPAGLVRMDGRVTLVFHDRTQ